MSEAFKKATKKTLTMLGVMGVVGISSIANISVNTNVASTGESTTSIAFNIAPEQADAYIISSTGVTVEDADVTDVSTKANYGVATAYQSLKFLGMIIMLTGAMWLVTFIFSKANPFKGSGGS